MVSATVLCGGGVFSKSYDGCLDGVCWAFPGRYVDGWRAGGEQTHLSKTLPLAELTSMTVAIDVFACLGFVIGPTFALAFECVTPLCLVGDKACIPQLTAPGYFVLISALVTIGLLWYCFDDDDDRALAALHSEDVSNAFPGTTADDEEKQTLNKSRAHESSRLLGGEGRLGLAILICNLVYFAHFFGFAVQETITTPLVQAYYKRDVHKANVLFTAAGVCSLAVFVMMQWYGDIVDDKSLTYASLLVGATGFALLLGGGGGPSSVKQFLMAFALITIAFALGRAQCMSLYTKLLPRRLQGAGQGVILAVGAIARIIGPFIAVIVLWSDTAGSFVFGTAAAVFLGTAFLFRCFYNDLWPRLETGDSK